MSLDTQKPPKEPRKKTRITERISTMSARPAAVPIALILGLLGAGMGLWSRFDTINESKFFSDTAGAALTTEVQNLKTAVVGLRSVIDHASAAVVSSKVKGLETTSADTCAKVAALQSDMKLLSFRAGVLETSVSAVSGMTTEISSTMARVEERLHAMEP
jgi:hypothetical protein